MKMEVRVFANSPILVEEITAWFKDQEPRIPITVSVVERSDEHRTAVYALFLDAPVVVQSVAVAEPAIDTSGWKMVEAMRLDKNELLDLLEKWSRRHTDDAHDPELTAKTAELLKKHGRA